MIRCVFCGKEFDPASSLMADQGECQECWERECDDSWWACMRRLDEQLGPIVERTTWMDVNGDALRVSIAEFLQAAGARSGCSTGIHGCITRGYGPLDGFGFFRFSLPDGEYVG